MMKPVVFFLLWGIYLQQVGIAQTTAVQLLKCYNGKKNIFPSEWLSKKIRAKATAADTAKYHADTAAIINGLNKYPDVFIINELQHIYVVGTLVFNRVSFTSTNASDAIYIGSNSNNEVEKTFHHEFSSILLRNHPNFEFETKWRNLSPAIRGGNSAAAVRAGLYSTGFDSTLSKNGYLSPYSLSNWENDCNMYAENLFAGGADFWQIVEKYPKVKEKTTLIIDFYKHLWSGFSYNYFRFLGDEGGSYFKKLMETNLKKISKN